jgi:hypothetical protein
VATEVVLDLAGLQALVDVLRERGYTVLGPVVRDGAVAPSPVTSVDELPRGWGDEQDGAFYRLRRRGDDALFGFASGAQSWKPVLFPARHLLWQGRRTGDGFTVEQPTEAGTRYGRPPYALLGVRSCDLHAIAIHDRVLLDRPGADAHYATARQGLFVVAVACSDPAGTCFCVSMRTGPRPDWGFDLCLTEIGTAADGHRLLVEVGSDRGDEVLAALPAELVAVAGEAHRAAAARVTEVAAAGMGRELDTDGLPDLLLHVGRRRERPDRRHRVPPAQLGLVLHGGLLPPARRECPGVGALALPAVGHPQAGLLDRPVRHLGLRGLRPLHHVVPGGHRHHRGGRCGPRRAGPLGRRGGRCLTCGP